MRRQKIDIDMRARPTIDLRRRTSRATHGRSLLILAIAMLAVGLAPAGAFASSADNAATHTYILANYALLRASDTKVAVGQADFKSYYGKINRECKGAANGSPENEAAESLNSEATGALWAITYGVAARPIHTFVDTVKRLHWSNHALTRMVQSYAATLLGLGTLPMPNLCGDVKAWSASGFQTIPPSTTSFDRHVETLEARPVPMKLLTPYEQPEDHGIAARATSLERKLLDIETSVGYNDLEALLETLGLHL